jgi:selenocysteine lyase/cysteine desulfurase
VDAAQSAGHFPLDVQADNIDLLAFSAHKGTLGPPGVGVLYIGPGVNPDTQNEGGTGSVPESPSQPEILPDKYESGTLNSSGISGLAAGLRFILDEGFDNIRDHEFALTQALIAGLKTIPGVTIYHAVDEARQAPVVSFNIAGYEPGEVGVILDQAFDIKARSGLHCSPLAHKSLGTFPGGTVRLSPGYFNTSKEIDQTVQAVKQIARARKNKI